MGCRQCTPLPIVLFDGAYGWCIVKVFGVFGVYGEGGYLPEIFSSGNFLFRDFGEFVCCFFQQPPDIRGSPNSAKMACISVVLSPAFPKMSMTCPMGSWLCLATQLSFNNSFVAGLSAFQLFFRNRRCRWANVRFSVTGMHRVGNLQCSYKMYRWHVRQYFNHLTLCVMVLRLA